ncbi:MAG: hypothetical protein QM764_22445 [Chitinophagaceae bacterium]
MLLKSTQFLSVLVFLILPTLPVFSQDLLKKESNKILSDNDFTISYSLQVKSNKSNTGIGETYNGGVKTIFISGNKIRTRLVSLMRIESIFQFPKNKSNKIAAITKESGKAKYRYLLTKEEWKQLNAKYDSASCQLTYDSAVIFNYPCRKAIVTLKDGRSVGVYYTDSIIRKDFKQVDPLFATVPGVVLQYEYFYKKGSVVYTVADISYNKIDPSVFRVPAKGIVTRKFSMKPLSKNSSEVITEEESDEEEKNQ